MGEFFGSVQVRSDNRPRVCDAVDQVCKSMNVRALVGPLLGKWIGIYPEHSGQDQEFGKRLAKSLKEDVLHMLLHDGDVFMFQLHRNGKSVASFDSNPGYFKGAKRVAKRSPAGYEVYEPIIRGAEAALAGILDSKDTQADAFLQISEFADALGIANARTSYEQLKSTSGEGADGLKEFVELPADKVAAQTAAIKAAASAGNALIADLTARGVILFHEEKAGPIPRCCAVDGGLLAAWTIPWGDPEFLEIAPPWNSPRRIPFPDHFPVSNIAADAAGRRILLAGPHGARVCVREGAGLRAISSFIAESHSVDGSISPDGKIASSVGQGGHVFFEADSGAVLFRDAELGSLRSAFHPSSRWAVQGASQLEVIELNGMRKRTLRLHGENPQAGGFPPAQLAALDKEVADQQRRLAAELQGALADAENAGPKSTAGRRKLAKLKAEEANLQEMRQNLAKLASGELGGASVQRACFSHDGHLLFLAVSDGLRVYEWDAIVTANAPHMPPALHDLRPDGGRASDAKVYAVQEEPGGTGLVFSGIDGWIRRFDLQSHRVDDLIKMPHDLSVIELAGSLDGQAVIACSRRIRGQKDPMSQPSALTVFSTKELLRLGGAAPRP